MPQVKSKQRITFPKTLLKKEGVVVLPIGEFERMKEDLEMISSKSYLANIKKARKEIEQGQVYSLDQVKKALNI